MSALKEHYRGDLHRCNLKRKVQGLLPLSAADFQSRSEELVTPAVVQPVGREKRSRKLSKEARQRDKQEQRARRHQEKFAGALPEALSDGPMLEKVFF